MKTDGRLGWVLLSVMSFFGAAEAATLTSPARSGDQFQFELQGDAYRHYVIQGSSNLVNWVSLATNFSPSATRPLSFTASDGFQFYRSAPFIQSNALSKAIRLTSFLDVNGNNLVADSFNSTNPTSSTAGLYDPAKRRDSANLSLDAGLTNSLAIGSVTIFGDIATGPGAPLQIGSYGSIGEKQWHAEGRKGIQPGRFSVDFNPYFPDALVPFTNGMDPTLNQVVTNSGFVTFYDYVFDDGDYLTSTLTGKILVRGNARVYVAGNIMLSGSSDIILIKTNASLKLYVGATNVTIRGNAIVNESGNATNFVYYGLPANTNFSMGANASLTGIIYAPQARITLGGGSVDAWDFIGAIVADSLRLNGHWHFHYDEALRDLPFPE